MVKINIRKRKWNNMEFIKFTDVEKVYKTGVTAIYGLNIEIKKGDYAFVIGA